MSVNIKGSTSYSNLSLLLLSNNKFCTEELVIFCTPILINRTTEFLIGLSFNLKVFSLAASLK